MKKQLKIVGKHMLLALLAFIWLIPIVWLLVTSFSSYKGINTMHFSRKDGLWTITCSCFSGRIPLPIFRPGFGIP